MAAAQTNTLKPWQQKIHEIIFEADTLAGKIFDFGLLVIILASVGIVLADSVSWMHERYGKIFGVLEWVFTILFTIEYILRILSLGKPAKYIFSFFGIIDLLSILPSYLGIFLPNLSSDFMIVRAMRLLRIFRLLKLVRFMGEADVLMKAIIGSRTKILVFLFFLLITVCILGTLMYIIEAPYNDRFTSIPRAIYWAIVTLTTVGYGDIAPVTSVGQFLSAIIMILGYAIIAVPTGIVTSELANSYVRKRNQTNTQVCQQCAGEGHDNDAIHCKHCGAELNP